MKKIIVLSFLFSIGFSFPSFSQQEPLQDKNYQEINPNPNTGGFSLVDQWPMYPGGIEGVNKHVEKELKYPKEAKKEKIEGRVVIRYVVQTDGSVGEIQVIESVHPLLDEEAIRVIKRIPPTKYILQFKCFILIFTENYKK